MARKVLGIHLVCRNKLNIEELGDGRFKSGDWKVSEQVADTALYLALHDEKNLYSYKQGIIESWERYDGDGGRIVFYVKEFDRRLEWVGGGTREKGYCWSEK